MSEADAQGRPSEHVEPQAEQLAQPKITFSWSSLAKAGAAALGATAAALNFIGPIAYSRYLGHWGFDEGMLPLDASNRLHYGYMAVYESVYTLLLGGFGALLLTILFVVGGIQIWAMSLVADRPPGDTGIVKWIKRNFARLPRSVQSLFRSFSISGVIVILLYYVAFIAFVGLAAAPYMGKHAADKWAKNKEDKIKMGCQGNGAHGFCTELRLDGKVVGVGLIIASSTTRIAYFDIAANRGRLIKFEDGELTGWAP